MEYNESGQPVVRTTASYYDWSITISNGTLDGVGYIEKFGRNDTLSGNPETIWDGSNLYTYISTASSVYITSSDGDDATAGTGARTIEVQGLDENYALQTETINVDDSASTTTFIRVFRAIVKTVGSGGQAAGVISIRSASGGGGTLLAQIGRVGTGGGASLGQTFMALYTIPAGKTGYLTQWTVGAGGQNADTTALLLARPFDGDTAFNSKDIVISAGNQFSKDYKIPLMFTEKTDIEVRAFSSSSGNDCSSTFNILLIDNPS
jgi:hypothetical protein